MDARGARWVAGGNEAKRNEAKRSETKRSETVMIVLAVCPERGGGLLQPSHPLRSKAEKVRAHSRAHRPCFVPHSHSQPLSLSLYLSRWCFRAAWCSEGMDAAVFANEQTSEHALLPMRHHPVFGFRSRRPGSRVSARKGHPRGRASVAVPQRLRVQHQPHHLCPSSNSSFDHVPSCGSSCGCLLDR